MRANPVPVGASLLMLVAAAAPCLADPVELANRVRSQGCGQASLANNPLRPDERLDEAARLMAGRGRLEAATSAAGYRAKASASIHVRAGAGDEDISRVLRQRHCDIVADPGLHDIGVYQRGDHIWMVLARPLAAPAADLREVAERLVNLINDARSQRRRCGRKRFPATTALQRSERLEHAALAHARDMAEHGFMGHEGSDRSMPPGRVQRAGYAWDAVAENVAAGQTSAAEVVETWLASPTHCATLMSPRYSDTGVAFAADPDDEKGVYWVQVFARPAPPAVE